MIVLETDSGTDSVEGSGSVVGTTGARALPQLVGDVVSRDSARTSSRRSSPKTRIYGQDGVYNHHPTIKQARGWLPRPGNKLVQAALVDLRDEDAVGQHVADVGARVARPLRP